MLQFKRYELGEEALYLVLVEDLRVMKYITERALSSEEGKAEFSEILTYNEQHQDGTGYFKVYQEDTYVGFAKVSWRPDQELEVGYILLPAYWGQGIGREILTKLVALVASNPDLATAPVMAVIDPTNGASKHLLTSHGFETTWQGIEDELPTEYLHLKKV